MIAGFMARPNAFRNSADVGHEAISEVPMVLPGDSFETVIEVHKPGTWMFKSGMNGMNLIS